MREYIVTVADPSVWDTLWNELTTDGLGDNFIPQRAVEVTNERPFNDNCAHFNLTDEEAQLFEEDEDTFFDEVDYQGNADLEWDSVEENDFYDHEIEDEEE